MNSGYYDKSELRLQRLLKSGRYSLEQSKVIQESIEKGLEDIEIMVYLNERLNPDQMRRCMYGFTYGLQAIDVEKYAKECYSSKEMDQIRYALMNESERNVVAYLLKGDFDESQMLEIRKGNDLPDMYIQLYAVPYYTAEQMKEIRLGFQHGLSLKHISCYCDARFSDHKMNMIRKGFEKGISAAQVLEYAQPDISEDSLYRAIKVAEKTVGKRSHKKRGMELSL